MKHPKMIWFIAALFGGLLQPAFAAAGPWNQPAAALASRIADVLGPGQARLSIFNRSAISTDQISVIRKMLAQDLKASGITLAGAESANEIRVTLSEDARERLWVAEIAEGDASKVVMVELGPAITDEARPAAALVLRGQPILTSREPVLAALDMGTELITLEPDQIVTYVRAGEGWKEQERKSIGLQLVLARDPRGALVPEDTQSFEASLPGAHCIGNASPAGLSRSWNIECHASDDPWTVNEAPLIHAFYNASRNYFTGVLTPDPGPTLPPFYSIAVLPRPMGTAVLIGGIDGRLQVVENGSIRVVTGARDWGSDFAALQSGCGTGTQLIASSSGAAATDSLRAYDIAGAEAQPASEPLDVEGTVTALSTAPDRNSIIAIVRSAHNQYEVDRVTALCN